MHSTTTLRAVSALTIAGLSSVVYADPVYLSCVYDSGPQFAHGTPMTFTFDAEQKQVLLGNGVPALGVYITDTEVAFLHEGVLQSKSVPITIDRISGRFQTTVSTKAGEISASGACCHLSAQRSRALSAQWSQ